VQGAEDIGAGLRDKSREAQHEPVDEVATMNGDEVNECVDEHGEHFTVWVMEHSCERLGDSFQFSATVATKL